MGWCFVTGNVFAVHVVVIRCRFAWFAAFVGGWFAGLSSDGFVIVIVIVVGSDSPYCTLRDGDDCALIVDHLVVVRHCNSISYKTSKKGKQSAEQVETIIKKCTEMRGNVSCTDWAFKDAGIWSANRIPHQLPTLRAVHELRSAHLISLIFFDYLIAKKASKQTQTSLSSLMSSDRLADFVTTFRSPSSSEVDLLLLEWLPLLTGGR